MLLADDERRWVVGNAAASELLGIPGDEVPWRSMDEFTPPSELQRLKAQWAAFLVTGAAEGWLGLYVPGRGPIPVEFSAIANVLPARHLAVFVIPEASPEQAHVLSAKQAVWTAEELAQEAVRIKLTKREQEIMTLVAAGGQSGDIARQLVLSAETVDSHVHNAREKLGARTRAHAVAIALVTDQITWPDEPPAPD